MVKNEWHIWEILECILEWMDESLCVTSNLLLPQIDCKFSPLAATENLVLDQDNFYTISLNILITRLRDNVCIL